MLSCQAPFLSCPYLSFVVAIQAPACVQLFVTPWTAACQASPSLTVSQSMPMFMSIASATPSSHLISSHLNLSFNHHLSVYLVPVSPDNKLHRVCSPPSHPKANTSVCDTTNAQQTLQSAWLQSQTLCSQRGLCFSVPVAGTPRPSCTPAKGPHSRGPSDSLLHPSPPPRQQMSSPARPRAPSLTLLLQDRRIQLQVVQAEAGPG